MLLCAKALTTESNHNPPKIAQINDNPLQLDDQIMKLRYVFIILVLPFI